MLPSAGIATPTLVVQTAVSVRAWIFQFLCQQNPQVSQDTCMDGAGLTKGHLDQMLGKKKNHKGTAAASSSNMDREKCQTSSYLSFWGKWTRKKSNFQVPSMALQWSGATNLVHRQGNNGSPPLHLPFCVPTTWNSTHLSINLHRVWPISTSKTSQPRSWPE